MIVDWHEWRAEFSDLARYNGEVSRGVVHTPEWTQRMAELQRRFNAEYVPFHEWKRQQRRRWWQR